MLAVLLEQQHGEEAESGPSARDNVEWCWRLRDLLAISAGELLADGLDDLPLAEDHFQGLGDVLAQLRQPGAAAGRARTRRRHDNALARQVLGKGLLHRRLALEAADAGGLLGGGLGDEGLLAGVGLELLEQQLHLVEQAAGAFGAGAVLLALQLGDLQLEMGDQRRGGTLASVGVSELRFRFVDPQNGCRSERQQRFHIVRQGGNGGDQE